MLPYSPGYPRAQAGPHCTEKGKDQTIPGQAPIAHKGSVVALTSAIPRAHHAASNTDLHPPPQNEYISPSRPKSQQTTKTWFIHLMAG